MSAIPADLWLPKKRRWSWVTPVVLGLIMSMGLFVSKTKTSSGGGEDAFLSWDAAPGATGYRVWGNLNQDGPPYDNVTDVGNVTSVDQSDLSWVTSGTWYLNITSYDESDLDGPYGSQLQVVVP